jgi:hexosaminidase
MNMNNNNNKKSRCRKTLLYLFLIVSVAGLAQKMETVKLSSMDALIPKPQSVVSTGKEFKITKKTKIYIGDDSPELNSIANYLANKLRPATGFSLPVTVASGAPVKGSILLTRSGADTKSGEEGYKLAVTTNQLKLMATSPAGLFRGVQTIRQLLPAAVESSGLQKAVKWIVPTGTITDFPNYAWRGVMLDVARHFFSVDDVKRLLDEIAYYKLNVFHWHLSDDQGWRIEIKSWPNLTARGGSTQVGGGKGGFYTQQEYKEVVNYAAERYITVVPEIDMPGHTNAALASYPELNCNGKAPELYTGIEVGFSTLCTNKDITYKFIDDVVRELAEMTPGPYLHIGGDESHATKKEDYIPFVSKVQDIVAGHGKKVVGWDEIALTTLKPNTMAQFWADAENGKMAIAQGAKLIMSPARKTYLDMSYDPGTKLGLHWAAYIELDSAYAWDPANYAKGINRENIYGVESALWSETIQTRSDIEYLVFPRLPGHAEIGWSAARDGKDGSRNWQEYKLRLATHGPRLKAMGINFYQSKLVPW